MARKPRDLVGQRFGRLVVVRQEIVDGRIVGQFCRCDCGGTKVVRTGSLSSGTIRSCGCLQIEQRLRLVQARQAKLKPKAKKEKPTRKTPITLCESCIRSAAPPELQCVWDASKAQKLPEGAETVIVEKQSEQGTTHVFIVSCPEYLSLHDEKNVERLQIARKKNRTKKMREYLEYSSGSIQEG